MSRTSSERLMYAQFTFCVYEVSLTKICKCNAKHRDEGTELGATCVIKLRGNIGAKQVEEISAM